MAVLLEWLRLQMYQSAQSCDSYKVNSPAGCVVTTAGCDVTTAGCVVKVDSALTPAGSDGMPVTTPSELVCVRNWFAKFE
jgi:hypothetical protein